jgi:hypothetical protein
LKDVHGFEYLVVEQDPVAIETIGSREYRGNVQRVAELAKRYPTHIGFSSDQDLTLLAEASGTKKSGIPAVWGIEQAQGAARYLEELTRLAPNAATRAEAERLLALARTEDRTKLRFMHDEPQTVAWVQGLQRSFKAKPGSRADYLLNKLLKSVEIYSYNRRGSTEPVGLFNNTVREALFKENFMAYYRKAAKGGKLPRALFKMGDWHMYRGRSPGSAFTIGSFAHEFAIANGMKAFGMSVLPFGGDTKAISDMPAWIRPILPPKLPSQPVVIDLQALQPRHREFTAQMEPAQRQQLQDYIHAFDAVVILPNSQKASWNLTGFPPR